MLKQISAIRYCNLLYCGTLYKAALPRSHFTCGWSKNEVSFCNRLDRRNPFSDDWRENKMIYKSAEISNLQNRQWKCIGCMPCLSCSKAQRYHVKFKTSSALVTPDKVILVKSSYYLSYSLHLLTNWFLIYLTLPCRLIYLQFLN